MSTSPSRPATAATPAATEGTAPGGSRPPGRETLRSVWAGGVRNPLTWVLLAAIRLYQLTVSPMLGPVCRFYPSCSHYGFEAIRVHGPLRGTWYTAYRLVRCHPWNPGGIDPVPPRRGHHGHPAHRGRSAPQSARSATSDRTPTAEPTAQPAGARAGGGPDQGA